MVAITRESLSREVCALLDLPYDGRQGTGYEIVRVILRTIIKGLRNGERVKIAGFGIFSVKTRPAFRTPCYFYPYLKKKGLHCEVLTIPARQFVHFAPSKVLKRMINE